MTDLNLDKYTEQLYTITVAYVPQLALAIVVLFVGLWLIRKITRGMEKAMQAREVDASLTPFLRTMTSALLKVVLVISVIQMVGVQTTSFIAVLGAAGLAIGMALSGTLQNFAGGVIILVMKPFKVGDFIEAKATAVRFTRS